MDWDIWNRIEPILIEYNIKPILAVVPLNLDSNLDVMCPRGDFWKWVRECQERGWTIALHGFNHLYQTQESGLVGINNRSEFAGLPLEVQRKKLAHALSIFKFNGINAEAWVAPAHSFDSNTVKLLRDFNINVISDGFFFRPVKYIDSIWLPQQLWKFRPIKFGSIWTVCFHINNFLDNDVERFISDIAKYQKNITNIRDVLDHVHINEISIFDRLFANLWKYAIKIKRT